MSTLSSCKGTSSEEDEGGGEGRGGEGGGSYQLVVHGTPLYIPKRICARNSCISFVGSVFAVNPLLDISNTSLVIV